MKSKRIMQIFRSKLIIDVGWFVIIVVVMYFGFTGILVSKILAGVCFVGWGTAFTWRLHNLINLKYRVIDNHTGEYLVEYLTSLFLFIPYWRSVYWTDALGPPSSFSNIIHRQSFKEDYETHEEAVEDINRHKHMMKNNRQWWLKNTDKKDLVYYY